MDELDRVLRAFETLRDQHGETRALALEALRAENPRVHQQVVQMLENDTTSGSAFDTHADHGLPGALVHAVTDLYLPKTIGPFTVVREIGRGGMGVVFEAEQAQPRRRVALKTLHPLANTVEARERFKVEVQALAQLLHPGIPQLYESFDHGQQPVLVMELVKGRGLLEATDNLDRQGRLRLLTAIAEAVQAAHASGVLHRDLKPENILVTEVGPKILDFGIASLGGDRRDAAGTLETMSPEQLAGEPVDARTDVYSLGTIAWHVLLGRPFLDVQGKSVEQILQEKRRSPPGTGLSPSLDRVLSASLQPDLALRIPDAATLASELRRLTSSLPIETAPIPTWHRIQLFLHRERFRLPLIVAAIVVTILAGLAGRWTLEKSDLQRKNASAKAALDDLQEFAANLGWNDPRVAEEFETYVQDEAQQGTLWLSRAWLWRANHDEAVDRAQALSQSWVTATDGADARRAVELLADELLHQERWQALEGVLKELPEGSHQEARTAIDAWHQRWTAVQAHTPDRMHGITDALARRKEIESAELLWRGRVVGAVDDTLQMHTADGNLLAEVVLPDRIVTDSLSTSDQGVHARTAHASYWWGGTELSEVPTPRHKRYQDAERHDAAVAIGPELAIRHAGGPWIRPDVDFGGGYAIDADVGDVDGDGALDAVVAMGGWRSTGLQVWSDILGEAPRLLHREPGLPSFVRVFRGPDGRDRVALVSKPEGTLPLVPPDVQRPPSHLYVFDVRSDVVQRSGPFAPMRTRAHGLDRLDLDGDGIDDLFTASRQGVGWVLRQDETGTLERLRVPHFWGFGSTNLDNDPADEMLGYRHGERFLVGVGPRQPDRPKPPLPIAREADEAVPSPLRRSWSRAESLAAMGLRNEAVRGFALLGRRPGEVGRRALRRALEIHGPPISLGVGSIDESPVYAEVALAYARRTDLTDEDRDYLTLILREILEVDALGNLTGQPDPEQIVAADSWQILDPTAVTLDPLDDSLVLNVAHTADVLLALDLDRTDDVVDIALDLDLEEHDWLAGIELRLEGSGFAKHYSIGRGGGGPEDNHRYSAKCGDVGPRSPIGMHHERVHLGVRTLRLTLDSTVGRMRCRFDPMVFQQPLGTDMPEHLRLTLRPSSLAKDARHARVRARLRRVRLRGVTVRPREASPWWSYVRGERDAVQATLEHPEPWIATDAAARLGHHDAADLRALHVRQLATLLRRDPVRWSLPVQRQRPEVFEEAFYTAWAIPNRYQHPWRREAMRQPVLQRCDLSKPEGREVAYDRSTILLQDGRTLEARVLLEDIVAAGDHAPSWRALYGLRRAEGDDSGATRALERWSASAADPFEVQDILRSSDP